MDGPFLLAVEKLGCAWVVVLKQERMDVFKEAHALSQNQKPDAEFEDPKRKRQVRLWQVKDLSFSEGYGSRPVSVVRSEERWTETKVVGGDKQLRAKAVNGGGCNPKAWPPIRAN